MKKLFIPGGLLAALLVFLVLAVAPTGTSSDQPTTEAEVITPSAWKAQLRAQRTDPKAPKSDGPDQIALYHQQIRTFLGDEKPRYEVGYQYDVLKEAKTLDFAKNSTWANRQLDWVERGPANVSGRTRGIVVDVRDASLNTWFAGSVGGGVWKTEDAGRTWRHVTEELPNLATVTVVQCESQPNIFYLGTGEGFFNTDAVAGAGIWKSTDGGETWEQLASTSGRDEFRSVNRLIVDPNNPDVVVAANNLGIYRTADGGATWTLVSAGGPNREQQIVADPTNFNLQYATSNSTGVYKSDDAGQTWRQTLNLSSFNGGNRIEMAVAPSAPNRMYAIVDNGGATTDVYLSNDFGETWAVVNEPNGGPNWLGGQGWYDNTVVVHPFDEDIFFAAGQTQMVRVTVAGAAGASPGRNTTVLGNTVHPDHHNLTIVTGVSGEGTFRIVNGNDGGVAWSDDGGTIWFEATQFASGYNTTQFYGADKRPGAPEFIGGMQDNGTWRSPGGINAAPGTSWLPQLGGDGFTVAWHGEDPNLIIGGTQFNGLNRSLDGGRSWNAAVNGLTDTGSAAAGGKFITNISKVQNDPDLLFVTGNSGIWRSDDFGANWRLAEMEDTGRWFTATNRIPVAISPVDPQIVWSGGAMGNGFNIFLSEDGGLSFAPTPNLAGVSSPVSGMAAHPTERETGFVLFASRAGNDLSIRTPKLLRTTDLGQTWEDLSGTFQGTSTLVSDNGFPNVATYDLLVMPFDTNVIWLGTEIGLFISEDAGQTWARAETGFPAASIWQLSIVDDHVVVATHGRGVWSVQLPELADYAYPEVVRAPRLDAASFSPSGSFNLQVSARSAYDSLAVAVDGVPQKASLEAVSAGQFLVTLPFEVSEPTDVVVSAAAFKDGRAFFSFDAPVTAFPPVEIQRSYTNNFDDGNNADFTGNGFAQGVRAVLGAFRNGVLTTTPSPYPSDTELIYQLRTPILIAQNPDDAVVIYEDIAMIQPGDFSDEDAFGSPSFRDYVVVEGSLDGATWIPLADGYDHRFDDGWRSAFNSGNVSESLLVSHELRLHDTFAPGEVMFLRFRLFADADGTGGPGWIIENLQIQPNAPVSNESADDLPSGFTLGQNYPNPFNPSTTVPFALQQASEVSVKVYDLQGRLVATVAEGHFPAGEHTVRFNANTLASGVYVYRLEAGSERLHRTFTLLK